MNRRIACLVLALSWLPANVYAEPLAFPGAKQFPIVSLGDDDDALMHSLYNARVFAPGPLYPICQPQCGLSMKAKLAWRDTRGRAHAGYVIAAEPDEANATHADGGLIGMVDLVHTARGWTIAAGSPVVVAEGSFGTAPEAEIIDAGGFGMAVITKPGFTNQGESKQNWNLYVERGSSFQQALSLPMLVDNSDRCGPTPACTRLDFTSTTTVEVGSAGLSVRVTRTLHNGTTASRVYHVKP